MSCIQLKSVLMTGRHRHPAERDWRRFLRGELPREVARSMSLHLEACMACQRAVERLPASYRCLGRPLPPLIPMSPPAVEDLLDRDWVPRLLRLLEGGGCVCAAAPAFNEALLLHLLTLAGSRLRRQGVTVATVTEPFASPEQPAVPEAEVVIVPDAPAYGAANDWPVRPRGLLVLAGLDSDWRAARVQPTLRVDQCADARGRTYQAAARAVLASRDARIQGAAMLNAFGVDVPLSFFPDGVPEPFLRIEDRRGEPQPWISVPGQWMAFEAVRELAALGQGPALLAAARAALRTLPGTLERRFEFRLAARANSLPYLFA